MPKDGGFKRKVRERMKKTGESYMAAKGSIEGLLGKVSAEDDGYDPLDTLPIAGFDEDDLPLYMVKGEPVTLGEAHEYLVEQGLEDPELYEDD